MEDQVHVIRSCSESRATGCSQTTKFILGECRARYAWALNQPIRSYYSNGTFVGRFAGWMGRVGTLAIVCYLTIEGDEGGRVTDSGGRDD